MTLFAEILCCLVVLRAKNIIILLMLVSLSPLQINVSFVHHYIEWYWYMFLENF